MMLERCLACNTDGTPRCEPIKITLRGFVEQENASKTRWDSIIASRERTASQDDFLARRLGQVCKSMTEVHDNSTVRSLELLGCELDREAMRQNINEIRQEISQEG